jgi:hypothetical protein
MGNKCKCGKTAIYNKPGEPARFCKEHKSNEMVNVKHKKCKFPGCTTTPYFNYENLKSGLYCAEHKLENMINIKSPRCKTCNNIASYNLPTKKIPEYCKTHKLDNMVDITHKKCIHLGCNKAPSFNYSTETTPLYCSDHKLEKMVDVVHNKCIHPGCTTTPHFNFENETKGLYCAEHKLDTMVNVISKTCAHEGCKTLPFYNYVGLVNGLYCNKHKLKDMIDVKSKKCIFKDCTSRPLYNYITEKDGLYCKEHKLKDMIDIINRRCKSKFCDIMIRTNKYKGYCVHCFVHLFPNEKISTNYKTKETEVRKFILENHKDKKWICDKTIETGTSKRRPDFLLELEDKIIIVEVDENQHIKYDCTCENKRLVQISQDLNHKNLVFIRFNPDGYTNNKEIQIESCWKLNKSGTLSIRDDNIWNVRLNNLNDQINYWSTNPSDKTIEVIHMYYDGFN